MKARFTRWKITFAPFTEPWRRRREWGENKNMFVNHVRRVFFISWWKRDAKRWSDAQKKTHSERRGDTNTFNIMKKLVIWILNKKESGRGGWYVCKWIMRSQTNRPASASCLVSRALSLFLCVGNRVYQIHINQMFIFWLLSSLFSLLPTKNGDFRRKFVDSKQIQSTGTHIEIRYWTTIRRCFCLRTPDEIEKCNLKWKMRCFPLGWRANRINRLRKYRSSYPCLLYLLCFVLSSAHSLLRSFNRMLLDFYVLPGRMFAFCWHNLISRHSRHSREEDEVHRMLYRTIICFRLPSRLK